MLEHLKGRPYWDATTSKYMIWDAKAGDFVPEPVHDEGWYWHAQKHDVPVHTVFGTYSDSVPGANVVQDPLHYRGNLVKVMDPTVADNISWLKGHIAAICYFGCDFTVRVTYDNGKSASFLLNRAADKFLWWSVNVPDEGAIAKVELFRRSLKNDNDHQNANHVDHIDASKFFDAATLVASRTFP